MIKVWVDKLKTEMTPLAAYGLIFIGFLALWLVFDNFSNRLEALKTQTQAAQAEYIALSQVKEDAGWEERLKYSLAARKQSDALVWSGKSQGVIAAKIQQALRGILAKTGMKSPQVSIDGNVENVDGVDVMRFTASGLVADGHRAIDVLAHFDGYQPGLFLQDFNITFRAKNPSLLTISGVAPIKIVTSQNATKAGGRL